MSAPSFADESPVTSPVGIGELVAGKYRVDRILAFGGMGVVCAATHVELETPVAIKFVRAELTSNADAATRFLNEAKAAAGLRGEHVARVIDFGTLPTGTPYMVMEFLQGSDLWALVADNGPLPITQSVDYVLQASEALAEAHAARIIHRDIKPENLFLAERPDGSSGIKVLDFGISKQLEQRDRSLTNPSSGLGSPYYMSPEQMCSPNAVDVRTDVWSMGCVLYVLVTGQLPFYSESMAGVCAKVLNEEPVPARALRPDLPLGVDAIIERCLQKERDARFNDIGELVLALAPFSSIEGQASITRVQRILARGSDPPPAPRSPPPQAFPHSLPGQRSGVQSHRAMPVAQVSPRAERRPRPDDAVPLVNRRPQLVVRRVRPARRSSRIWLIAAFAALAGGGAVVGARALGYDLPPVITRLVSSITEAPPPPEDGQAQGAAPVSTQLMGARAAEAEQPAPSTPSPTEPPQAEAPPDTPQAAAGESTTEAAAPEASRAKAQARPKRPRSPKAAPPPAPEPGSEILPEPRSVVSEPPSPSSEPEPESNERFPTEPVPAEPDSDAPEDPATGDSEPQTSVDERTRLRALQPTSSALKPLAR